MDKLEIMHITASVVTISLAFSIGALYAGLPAFLSSFPIVLLTLGVGFVLHEMAHRWMAKRYGCWAVYRAWKPGLAFAVGLALMTGGRFVFAAPGAVHIGGKYLTPKESGMIALAGPIMNIIVGVFFLLLFSTAADPLVKIIGGTGAWINFFLAFFNMIPFPPLDGSKILQWNTMAWLLPMAVAAFFSYVVF